MSTEPVTRRGVCPHDCPDTCALLLEVEDEKVVRVHGDPAHPVTKGFLCNKVNRYVDSQYMELDANPDFYNGRPLVDKYILRMADSDTMTAAMEAQEIDGTSVNPGPVYERLIQLPYITGNVVAASHPYGFVVNRARVKEDALSGLKSGVNGTPTFFINGERYDGPHGTEPLFEALQGALRS